LIFDREASSFGTPTAIVFDSTYLWYLGYNSITQEIKLIKVDLNGIGTPAFKIDSLMHDYGFIIFGDSSAWNCTIRNSGTAPLIIDQFTFPSATPFSADVSLPITISPGDSVKVKFTFLPLNTGRFDMNVIVHANDLCYPEKTINLKGIAGYAGAHIEIIVPGFDFGERRLKSTTLWKARIVNNGAQPLSISSITSGNPVFTIGKYSTFPIDIQFLDTTDVWIWFQPRKAKLYTDALSINSNSITQNPFTINITGTGKDSIYSPLSQLWDYAYIPLYGLEEPVAILPIGDISGDSIPDIVVSIGTGKLVCLNGNASGTADVLWSDSFGQFSHCRDQHGIATIPDMDGDSINDVVFADYNGDTVYALSGRTGIIIWKYGTQGIPEQVDATYDYNGDGIPDVLVAYSYSTVNCLGYNTAVRCLNSKTGSVIWSMATNYCAYAVKGVPDFTGDGKPDAVVAIREYYDVGPNPKIYGLDGSNGHISYSSDNSIVQYFIVIDDITGDGIPDLASIDFSGTVLTDLKTGIEQCGNFSYSGYHDLNLIDMGTSPGSPAKRILVSSSYIGIISPPDCSWEWWRNGFLATNAGDLNGDSINDVFFNNHPFKGTTDTIGYLNGKNGHLLKTQILNKEVNIARPFTDITGSGYSTVVVGGVGYIYCLSGAYISTTGIPETDTGKEQKSALQLFPNPASEIVNIRIELPEEGLTRLNVYDSRGMLIETIMNNELSRGRHDLRWDISGKNLSGLYFVQLLTGRYQETGKLMVVPSE